MHHDVIVKAELAAASSSNNNASIKEEFEDSVASTVNAVSSVITPVLANLKMNSEVFSRSECNLIIPL